MKIRRTTIFLILASLFALVHQLAVTASLYWYFWWFDIVMHFWGGLLITLAVFVLSGFSFSSIRPTFLVVIFVLLTVTITWELFEWLVGLYEPSSYLRDTAKDLVVGLGGGLLTHAILKRYTME